VRIVESRPLSKRKHWVVEEVLTRGGEVTAELMAAEAEALEAEDVAAVTHRSGDKE